MSILIDQIGVEHLFNTFPSRIVSLVPSQTELLFDLGLEQNIVGITKFCVHPKHFLKSKTIVGGTKAVHFDKIKALNPDIIIANKEENTAEMVVELRKICTVWVTNVVNISDNLQMISDFGLLFGKQAEAQKWVQKIKFAHADFEQFMKVEMFKKVAYFIWAKPFMVAANNTFINEMLGLNKFQNIFQDLNRYPEIEIVQLEVKLPDYIFLSSEPYPFKDKHKVALQQFTKAQIILVDGEYFSWHGSRILEAFDYFKKLHQNAAFFNNNVATK